MHIMRWRLRPTLLFSASLVFASWGCGDGLLDGSSGGSDVALSPAEVAEIGTSFEEDTDLSLGTLFHGGTFGWFDLSLDRVRALFPPGHRPHLPSPIIRCLEISPIPLEDPDNDGIPTLLIATFGPTGCSFTDRRGAGASFALTGTLTLMDPFPNTPGYDLDEELDQFGHVLVAANGSRSVEVTRDGTRSVRQTTDMLTATEQLTRVRTGLIGVENTVESDWVVEFTGDQAIVFKQPLPAGEVTVEGTWVFTRQARTREFEVTTVTPLRYDPTCTSHRPIRRITEGEIHVMFVVNGELHGTLAVVWDGCGPPRRGFTPA